MSDAGRYLSFSLTCYFLITKVTDVIKALAKYQDNCWCSLAKLLLNCEHANMLDRVNNTPKKSCGSVNLFLNKETLHILHPETFQTSQEKTSGLQIKEQ